MRLALIAVVVAVGFLPQTPGSAQAPAGPKVQIKFEEGGLVSLVANGATVREILAEWSRQGGSIFVNGERLGGAPLTLEFTHQPEKDVVASILRQAAGYVLGPRRAGTVGASSFEVVYILPTSNPVAGAYAPPATSPYQQQFSTPGAPDDELPPVGRGAIPGQPGATPAPAPAPDYRPAGVSPVAVPVIPVSAPPAAGTAPPPPPTTTGRGRGGGF